MLVRVGNDPKWSHPKPNSFSEHLIVLYDGRCETTKIANIDVWEGLESQDSNEVLIIIVSVHHKKSKDWK